MNDMSMIPTPSRISRCSTSFARTDRRGSTPAGGSCDTPGAANQSGDLVARQRHETPRGIDKPVPWITERRTVAPGRGTPAREGRVAEQGAEQLDAALGAERSVRPSRRDHAVEPTSRDPSGARVDDPLRDQRPDARRQEDPEASSTARA